jgi:5-methyltetrahydrofolate--homocysteine methyltransferase
VADGSLQARGVYGFWPASADGDDVVLDVGSRFPMLRQQADHADSRPNRSLADFVAPADVGLPDHIGAFAVAIHGSEALADDFAADLDDYHAIMVRALADRLAEAYAERLHEVARRAWYAPDEVLTNEERIGERFRGIRPAFGYPACPDHSEKGTLLELLEAERAGIGLTESYATTPGASVSGLYFGHPQARYFSVGRVGRDQVADYAERKGIALAEAERWLRQNLAYEP